MQHDTSLFRMTSVLDTALSFIHNSTCHLSLCDQICSSGFLSVAFYFECEAGRLILDIKQNLEVSESGTKEEFSVFGEQAVNCLFGNVLLFLGRGYHAL